MTPSDADAFDYLTPEERAEYDRLARISDDDSPPPFAAFVEATTKITLDAWQILLCERLQSLAGQTGQRILIHAPPQHGKPCYNKSMILLQNGAYKPLDQIVVGDRVITHDGTGCRVSAVHIQGDLPCVRITTQSGRVTVAALDHPFLTPEGWIEAGKLVAGQTLANVPNPQCLPVSGRRDDDYEMAGYFLGDGACGYTSKAETTCHANITSNDAGQSARIQEVASRMGFTCRVFQKQKTTALTYAFSGGIREWLRDIGIAGNKSGTKFVPEWVFQGTPEQIAIFLGAYFSCDGTISRKGLDRHGNERQDAAIEFYSISKQLLKDTQRLLLRLGVQSRLAPKNGRYQGNRHESWRLAFTSQDMIAQFASLVPIAGAKGEQIKTVFSRRKTFPASLLPDTIVSVEDAGILPCRCLTVENNHTFTSDDLVVHNSIIVSQRFPAWLLGVKPLHRIKLAAYNITHATNFSKIVRDIMTMDEYKQFFPQRDARLTKTNQQDSWFTQGRWDVRDAQPSFKALGLVTGFVGQGVDTLIIDDPYSSPQDALSEVIRNSTYMFWEESAKVRLNDNTNVVVMFHRYHEDDIAGRLIKEDGLRQDGGVWELLRFPAIADGDDEMPDPMRREVGEVLSPRYSREFYADLEKSPAWLGQFQGRPSRREGAFFNVTQLEILPQFPKGMRMVRAWDFASSANPAADYTTGVLMGRDKDGFFWILDVQHKQLDPNGVRNLVMQTAYDDGREVHIKIPIDPGLAGEVQGKSMVRMLSGYRVKGERVSGSKVSRAEPFAAMVNAGNVKILEGAWNKVFIEELRQFPLGAHDDQADAASDAFAELDKGANWNTGEDRERTPMPPKTFIQQERTRR